jgi:hypothetical protein
MFLDNERSIITEFIEGGFRRGMVHVARIFAPPD